MKMIELLQVLLPFVLIFFIGYWQAGILGSKSTLEKAGLSWLLGSAWITILSFLIHIYAKTNYSYPFVTSVLLSSFLLFGVIRKFEFPLLNPANIRAWYLTISFREKVLLLLLLFFCAYSVTQNLVWPITDWDSLALYDFRARVMIAAGSFRPGYELGYFFQYPPYTSLLHTISYLFGSEDSKLWYSLIFGSFLILFYYHLTLKVSHLWSLLGTVLLALAPYILEHSMVAYTNLSYTVFVVLSFIYLWQWLETKQRSHLLIGAFLLASSLWVRLSEPFWLVGILLIVIGMIKNRSHLVFATLSIFLILAIRSLWPTLVHQIVLDSKSVINEPHVIAETSVEVSSRSFIPTLLSYIGIIGNVSVISNQNFGEFFSRVYAVTDYVLANVVSLFGYLLIPWGIAAFADIKREKTFKVLVESGTLIIILLLVWTGTYIFSFTFETWDQIGGSASRMSMFIPPLIIYTIMTSSIWQARKKYDNWH